MNIFKARQDAIKEAEAFIEEKLKGDCTDGFKEYLYNEFFPRLETEKNKMVNHTEIAGYLQDVYICYTCGKREKETYWEPGLIDHEHGIYYCSRDCAKIDVKTQLDTLHNELNTLIQTYVIESRQRDIALSKIWEAFDLLYQVVK